MGKYGSKSVVSENVWEHTVLLLGESGIGKTTVICEMCEKLVGEDGYLVLDMGMEDGFAELEGFMREPCQDYRKFNAVIEDIVKNKKTDYPDLKIVVFDTIDQLVEITEPYIVARYNNENINKKDFTKATTINAAYNGFQHGQEEVAKLILSKIDALKKVGVTVWMCGHTKTKENIDPYTNMTYSQIGANLQKVYFNAFRTKVSIVGMAVIDRNIITESTGRKNVVTKKDITVNKVSSEARKIVFRDDNYGVDSKSRQKYIVDEIPLDADTFIEAIKEAIKKEKETRKKEKEERKSGKTSNVVIQKKPVVEEESIEDENPLEEDETSAQVEDEDFEEETTAPSPTDEDMRNEIKAKMKTADTATKDDVKSIIRENGGKLTVLDRAVLIQILDKFN